MAARIGIVVDLRDQLELIVHQSNDYARFLAIFLPVFHAVLSQTPPAYTEDAPEHVRPLLLTFLMRVEITRWCIGSLAAIAVQ
jgi:hypothetical protein